MSKMMAIIDEPDCCIGCKLCSSRSGKGFRCNLTGRYMDSVDLNKRPDWCELREIPEKKSEWGGCVEDNHGEVEWKEELVYE